MLLTFWFRPLFLAPFWCALFCLSFFWERGRRKGGENGPILLLALCFFVGGVCCLALFLFWPTLFFAQCLCLGPVGCAGLFVFSRAVLSSHCSASPCVFRPVFPSCFSALLARFLFVAFLFPCCCVFRVVFCFPMCFHFYFLCVSLVVAFFVSLCFSMLFSCLISRVFSCLFSFLFSLLFSFFLFLVVFPFVFPCCFPFSFSFTLYFPLLCLLFSSSFSSFSFIVVYCFTFVFPFLFSLLFPLWSPCDSRWCFLLRHMLLASPVVFALPCVSLCFVLCFFASPCVFGFASFFLLCTVFYASPQCFSLPAVLFVSLCVVCFALCCLTSHCVCCCAQFFLVRNVCSPLFFCSPPSHFPTPFFVLLFFFVRCPPVGVVPRSLLPFVFPRSLPALRVSFRAPYSSPLFLSPTPTSSPLRVLFHLPSPFFVLLPFFCSRPLSLSHFPFLSLVLLFLFPFSSFCPLPLFLFPSLHCYSPSPLSVCSHPLFVVQALPFFVPTSFSHPVFFTSHVFCFVSLFFPALPVVCVFLAAVCFSSPLFFVSRFVPTFCVELCVARFDPPCVEMAGRKKCGSGVHKESRKVKVFHEWGQQRKNRHVWTNMSHKIPDEEHASFCKSL